MAGDFRALARRRGRLHLHCERSAFAFSDLQPEGTRTLGLRHHESMRTPRLQPCCSPRSRRVMLGSFCPRAGASSSSCARSWTPRASLTSTVASVWIKLRHADEPRSAPSSWIAVAVAHPNRATKIVPLFSGNCTRWTRNSTSREVDAEIGVSHGGHATATGARSSASSAAVRVTAAS